MSETTRSEPRLAPRLPEGFSWRAPELSDLEDVAALSTLCYQEADERDRVGVDELRSEWVDPSFDLEADAVIVLDGKGRIVAWEEAFDRTAHAAIQCVGGLVHPRVRGLGLEEALLDWAEKRASELVPRAPKTENVELRASINESDDRRRRLFEQAGMSVTRHFFAMKIELEGRTFEPRFPEGVVLRELRPGVDERAFFAAKRESFLDHWGVIPTDFEADYERFLALIENEHDYDPTFFRAAWDGDEVAGICFTWATHNGDPEETYVSHVGVRRPWRRQGLATALLEDAFAESARRDKKSVSLGVDAASPTGAVELYESVGMKIEQRYDLFAKVLRPAIEERD